MAAEVPLTIHEAFSGVLGSISLATWLFVLLPQLVENYRAQSSAGVSILFLFIWFVGDIANLVGAIWAGLVPIAIAIAVYFCFADVILIAQCLYYTYINRKNGSDPLSREPPPMENDNEQEPLLTRRLSNRSDSSNIGLPGSRRRRRSSTNSYHSFASANGNADGEAPRGILGKILEDDELKNERSSRLEWLKNTVSILLICVVGAVGWVICWKAGLWKPTPDPSDTSKGSGSKTKDPPVGAEIVGYLSAILYLGARLPQIYKNYKDKSCEGLSLLFFLLSLMGNLTYGAGILAHSIQKDYVITNVPWLIGSLGTMVGDVVIFIQFRIYGEGEHAIKSTDIHEAVES